MSSGDVKEVPCSENEGKTELIPPKANLESKDDQPSVPVIEGSGDHLPPSNAMSTTPDDAPENTAKILPDDTGGLSKDCTEVSEGNSEKEIDKISANQSNCENKPLSGTRYNTELPVSELNISPSVKKDIITVTKPTFLEGVSSLASEDVDSENQDEELVLKWDDDDDEVEEENLLLKGEETDKNTVKDASTAPDSVSDLADNETKTTNTDETHNVANNTLSMDAESITEIKSSEDDILDDDQEDLLSEIDAQIAELGASISKAEDEELRNIENPGESKIPMQNNESSSENIKPSVSDEVIEIDMTEETTDKNIKSSENYSEEVPGPSKKEETVSTVIDIVETNVSKYESDNKQTELEKEDLLLKDDIDDSQKRSDLHNLKQNNTTDDMIATSPKTEANKNPIIVGSVTDNIVEKSQKQSVNEMDIETCANLEGSNPSLDHNLEDDLLKDTETQANSTKIDIEDVEMETTNKYDFFVHDSSNSFEEKQHGVNKPNVMLEIPTQELIDLDDSVIDKEMSVDDNELVNISSDLPDSKKEPNKYNDESVFETNTVEKETLIDNVSVEQAASKSTDRILDVKCPSPNQLQTKLNDNQVPCESVPKDDTLLLESVTCTAYAVTEPDKSPIQDVTEISQEHSASEEDDTISKVDVPTTVLHVEAPSTPSNVVSPTLISNVETPASISKVETPTPISNVETPLCISNVETPASISNVETLTSISNIEIPASISIVETPTSISNVETPTTISIVETPASISNVETPVSVSNVETPTPISNVETLTSISNVETLTSISNVETPASISNVETLTSVSNVETPTCISNDETPTPISNVEILKSISNVETLTSVSNVEILTSISNVETPLLNVEILSTASNIETPTTISDVNAPIQDEVSTPSESKVSNVDPKLVDNANECMDVDPSTTQMELLPDVDQCEDAADVTDSLGLLAESSRVRDEDDGDVDVDDQETSEHDDDDDDFDPDDESSNQQTAEHSEEDSAQQSESDLPKIQPDLETEVADSPTDADKAFDMLKDMDKEIVEAEEEEKEISEVADNIAEDKELNLEITEVVSGEIKETDGEIDIEDEIVCEEVEIPSDSAEVDENETEVDLGALKDTVDETTTEDAVSKEIPIKVRTESKLREILQSKSKTEDVTKSPSKKKLEISKPKHVVSIVDLESSSDDEGVAKPSSKSPAATGELTSVNISSEIEVMSSGDNTSDIVSKQGETVITLPKTSAHHKTTSRLNTSEITIKTASHTEPTLVIPETTMGASKEEAKGSKFGGLEVFNLDSDDEESPAVPVEAPPSPEPLRGGKCASPACGGAPTAMHYDARRKRRVALCEDCLLQHLTRANNLVEGIKIGTPLLSLEQLPSSQELVLEISDSDDDEAADDRLKQTIGEETRGMLERDLADMINATWEKFHMDARLRDAQDELTLHLDRLERESEEVSAMLDSCQMATDKLRSELYSTFTVRRHHLPPFVIYDTPDKYFMCPEVQPKPTEETQQASNKRRLSSASESQPKKPAIPLPNPADSKPEDNKDNKQVPKIDPTPAVGNSKMDDDKDVSVVTLSAESAPPDLPPCGEPYRAPLNPGQTVYAMRSAFGYWIKANILEVIPKNANLQFTQCKIKYENKTSRNAYKTLPARCLAYFEPANVRMTIGTRVVALFKDQSPEKTTKQNFSSGIVAEVPNPVNKYRYLIFFDDGYAQYVQHADTRLVCECSALVWEEVHAFSREFVRQYLTSYPERPMVRLHQGQSLKTEWNASYLHLIFFDDGYAQYVQHADTRLVCECSALVWEEVHAFSREFVRQYLTSYPERPMVRLHQGQSLKTEWNGKWWLSRVLEVDASLVHVYFEQDKRTEWIYRGSTRLAPLYLEFQAAEKHRARPLPRNRQNRLNMPYVEYTRIDEQETPSQAEAQIKAQQEEIRRQRAVAKKSTTPNNLPPQQPAGNLDAVTSRVVYYTPKNAVKPYKLSAHTCGPKCKRTDVLALKDLRTYNPLAKPLLSGWERQIVRFKGHKEVMYRAPCGRRLRTMAELHRYLRTVTSDMGVDLFDFGPNTHCLAEFVLNKCIVGKKDLSHGKENVPVPCVNYYDESLPEFCSYNTERTPTAGVPLNLDPEFLCGCDCTDDCQDKSKCACWKMTLEGAKTIGMDPSQVGYVYKRLPDPLPSGIYECNVRCKCKATCLNRVAQHPLQLKLQVFKTLNRGWGIRALNDVPKGSFLCIYAGNLLTDATANLDGLNEGDEYLAELDYIEVVEQMKEGYEDDIPEQDKKLDRKESGKGQESESEETESEEEASNSKSDADDGDFEPGYIPGFITGFNKRLRKRDKKKQKQKKENGQGEGREGEEDCITISDDEELREPSRFAAQAGMGGQFISKYRSVRTLFGKDEACYIMDAKVQGNIGRYLNHSCSPNVFVQNVFVDTHDPRFPWVAFFALTHIRAGTELTWNYNYDVGSVPGKALYCYCGAPNCRGRLL